MAAKKGSTKPRRQSEAPGADAGFGRFMATTLAPAALQRPEHCPVEIWEATTAFGVYRRWIVSSRPYYLRVFRAPSDSMAPAIAAGDIVEVMPCEHLDADGIFIVDINGAPALRRIQLLPGGRARLSTDAAPHAAEVVKRATVQVLGRVKRYWPQHQA